MERPAPKGERAVRVLIVDDERPARRNLRGLLAGREGIEVVGECKSATEAVRAIADHEPDLVFLDIQMSGGDGFQVLRSTQGEPPPVFVFVTAYEEHALEAFEANALDYLLKPFSDARFEQALERAIRRLEERQRGELGRRLADFLESMPRPGLPARGGGSGGADPLERLPVRTSGRVILLSPQEIDWIEAENVYVRIHCGEASHLVRETIGHLEERLGPAGFVRIHRSLLVNMARVREIVPGSTGAWDALLDDGTRLRVSRAGRRAIAAALGEDRGSH